MSVVINDTTLGQLQVTGLVEASCVNEMTNEELVNALPGLLTPFLPLALSGVVTGTETPPQTDRNKLWLRLFVDGAIAGLYAFQGDAWNPLYLLAPGQVVWITGDSNIPPKGFTVILPDDGTIPNYVIAGLTARYIPLQSGSGYAYFAVRFSGFI